LVDNNSQQPTPKGPFIFKPGWVLGGREEAIVQYFHFLSAPYEFGLIPFPSHIKHRAQVDIPKPHMEIMSPHYPAD
jgi:hypothetical protein